MAKSRRMTAEEFAAIEERSRQFKELLTRRRARDEKLKAAQQKVDPQQK